MAVPAGPPSGRRVWQPLARDTPVEVEARQIEAWRRMSSADKAVLISGLTNAALAMTRAGLRQRHPGASERELFLRLAVLTLGQDLAQRAYPDLDSLADS
jgi:hypothetical protein